MCGRFWIPGRAVGDALRGLPADVQRQALEAIAEWVRELNNPRFDVRPTNQYPVFTSTGTLPMRWGFRTDKSNAVFNARMESLRYPIWRESLVLRRGLVAAGGFYEWTGPKRARQAHAIQLSGCDTMLLAALFSGDEEACFTIITTPASASMRHLHDRMPMILEPDEAAIWINPSAKPPAIKSLIRTYAGPLQEFACVSPSNDTPPTPGRRELF